MSRVYRFGAGALDGLGELAAELELRRLVLVTSARNAQLAKRLPVAAAYTGVRPHAPLATVEEARRAAEDAEADAVVPLGGGSAIDTGKAVSAALEIPVVAVPTTYAGAEWTPYFGHRDEARGVKTGGSGATTVAAVYDPELTLGLPREPTVGTALNALAHCAEALYARGRSEKAERHAFCGARAIAYALPLVVADGLSIYARSRLLEGAMRAALALAEGGLALGHAMAQALGGRYGLPHGTLNAVCLPAALRYNAAFAPDALATLADAMATEDPIDKVAELAALGGTTRLRELGVPRDELADVATAAASRPGARANPREASPEDVERLYREVW